MIGYRYLNIKDVLWRYNQGGLLPLSPPSSFLHMSRESIKEVLKTSGAHFVRWESNFGKIPNGHWWHVIKEGEEHLEDLPKKTRYMIRKADKEYEAFLTSLEDIKRNGYDVYVDAFRRYETHEPMYDKKDFNSALDQLPPGTEFWGVYERDSKKMVGFSENYIEGNVCFYVTMWFRPDAMKRFAGYLLFHEMAKYYLNEKKVRYLSDGARSLSHSTNIHDFLESKFGFKKVYSDLNVIYAPWLSVLVAMVYPFRTWLYRIPLVPFRKASVILRQESIRRCRNKDG